MVQIQDSILQCLHHHTLSSMLSNEISEAHRAQVLSCFGLGAGCCLIARLVFSTFRLSSLVFFIALCMWLGLPHPSIASILRCVCTHPIDLMGIYLWCCVHGIEHIKTYDAICDTFATIMWNVCFHMQWKQLHVLPSTTFNSFCWQVDIVLTKDDIHTLADVVIVNPTWIDLLPQSCITQGFANSDVAQAKEMSYRNQHPINQFLSLAIEIFGCLHKHADVFWHNCANVIWSLRGLEGFHLSTLVTFLCQKDSITLQRMQMFSILNRMIAVGLVIS
jgi:hypothetical protein